MTNEIVRKTAKCKKVKLWEIADRLHIQDSAFSRKLRQELSREEREKILGIIDQLAQEKQEETQCLMF